MSLDQALSTVRQFQSETEAIREVKEPLATRITLYVLVAFILCGLFLITVTKLDRVFPLHRDVPTALRSLGAQI